MNWPSDKLRNCIRNPELPWATSIIFRGTTAKEECGRSETCKGSSAPWVGIREFVRCLKSDLAQDEVSRTRSRLAGAILSIVFNLRGERDREPVKFNDNPDSGSSILTFVPKLNQPSNSVLKIKGRHRKEVQYDPQDVEKGRKERSSRSPNHGGSPPDAGRARTLYALPWEIPCPSGIRTGCKADSFHPNYLPLLRKKSYIYALWLLQCVSQHGIICTQWLTRNSRFTKCLFSARL